MQKQLRRVARSLWVGLLAGSGCLWWAKRQLRRQGAVVAFVFHRVLSERDFSATHSQPEILVRERTFRDLAAYVERECEALDLHEARPGQAGEKVKVVFTFDDGWWDNYSLALPIAHAHGIPLTIFVCPQLVGKNMPFWPERVVALLEAAGRDAAEIKGVIESLKVQEPMQREQSLAKLESEMSQRLSQKGAAGVVNAAIDKTVSWQEMAQMDKAGVRFGSHTHSHEILTSVSPDAARRQVEGSDDAIEQKLGRPCEAFSYPNGSWSVETRNIVADAGFKLAVTVERRAWTADSDPLAIPRANVYEEDLVGLSGKFSPAMFEYTTIWKAWRAAKLKSGIRPGAQPQTSPATL
jgi:peptidoglycan/xylan/chitin deacetylase (PgdA/CDA1 family)